MKKLFKLLIVSMVLVVVLSTGILAAQVSIKLGFGNELDPFDASSGGVMYFKHYVEQESNGEIEVQIFPANQLGTLEEMIEQVKRGTIEMSAGAASGFLAGKYYPNLYVFDIPYLFGSTQVAWEVVNPRNEFMQKMIDDMAQKSDVRPLGFYVEGRRHFSNDVRPIKTPKDLKGLKIRTMSVPAHMEMVKALGGSPTPISYSELYSALQTGVVDGQENPVINFTHFKGYEVQDYLTLDGHITYLVSLVINEDFYKGLSKEHREIIKKGALEFCRVNTVISNIKNMTGVEECIKNGVKITTLNEQQLQQFRDVARPPVLEFIREKIEDTELIEELFREVEKYE